MSSLLLALLATTTAHAATNFAYVPPGLDDAAASEKAQKAAPAPAVSGLEIIGVAPTKMNRLAARPSPYLNASRPAIESSSAVALAQPAGSTEGAPLIRQDSVAAGDQLLAARPSPYLRAAPQMASASAPAKAAAPETITVAAASVAPAAQEDKIAAAETMPAKKSATDHPYLVPGGAIATAPIMARIEKAPPAPEGPGQLKESTGAAQAVTVASAESAGRSGQHMALAQMELASLVATAHESAVTAAQESSAHIAAAVNDKAHVQMAMNDTHGLAAIAPAAGMPVPGGDLMPAEVAPPLEAEKPRPAEEEGTKAALSAQSKAIIHALPPQRTKSSARKPKVELEHFHKNPLESDDVKHHEGVGISIRVRRPGPDINYKLEQAYEALIAGNQEEAVALYKDVLESQPENKLALFGLATTYHRLGQLTLARPLYGKLLQIDPHNAEGLNNFLVLLADESPSEALDEMKKLEHTHADFSPLPAQMAVIYEKMGNYGAAVAKMGHAIDLSPENVKYRYDMAVILDKQGDWDNAALYYQQVLTAASRGEKVPAKPEEIQERLTFIRSNKPKL